MPTKLLLCSLVSLTIYSNAPSLELFCNGVSVASASKTDESTGVVWKFPVKMGEAEKISYLCKNIPTLKDYDRGFIC